ncbi:MAG: class IV adenylate cyclase [Bacteroidota bacterium]
MTEIEIKILEVNKAAIHNAILKYGGTYQGETQLVDRFYDFPARSLSGEKKLIRLRQMDGQKGQLTFKQPAKASSAFAKLMQEQESEVSNPQEIHLILLGIGLILVKENRKTRTEFSYQGASIVIDDLQGTNQHVPPYLEIEAKTEEEIRQITQLLGYTSEDCLNWNTRQVLEHYQK